MKRNPLYARQRPAVHLTAGLLALGSLLTLGSGPARADAIDQAIREHMPDVLQALDSNQYKAVGVLRFRFSREGKNPSFTVGPINKNLADRFELALRDEAEAAVRQKLGLAVGLAANVLKSAAKPSMLKALKAAEPIQIVSHPEKFILRAAEEGKLKPAKGRTFNYWEDARDRQAVFGIDYKVKGNDPEPEAMLTGEIILSNDSSKATIEVRAFDKAGKELKLLDTFCIPTERVLLAECGQSFVVPRAVELKNDGSEAAAAKSNVGLRALPGDGSVPADAENPVEWAIRYDGKVQQLRSNAWADSCQFVVDPIKTDTKLTITMKNNGKERVGVVLAVNGENTLFQESVEERSPGQSLKWILDPGERVEVKGFYFKDGTDCQEFAVTDNRAPMPGVEQLVMNRGAFDLFGQSQGTFALYVFRECPPKTGGPKISGLSDRDFRRVNDRTYVVPGRTVPGVKFRRVDFPCLDQPSASMVVRYSMPSPS